MVTDELGRDVPVVRELRSMPGPAAVWRKRTVLPPRVGMLFQGFWIGIIYIMVKVTLLTSALVYALRPSSSSVGEIVEPLLFIPLSMFGTLAVFMLSMRSIWAFWGRPASARLMASRGHCPSCGSLLSDARVDFDGVTRCMACDAAWRVGSPEACPRCAYDLAGLSNKTKGTIVCPECAATWPAATKERVRIDRQAFRGSLLDDAGRKIAREPRPEARRSAVKARSKEDRERARLPGAFFWLGVAATAFLIVPAFAASFTWLAGFMVPQRGAEFAGGIAALAGVGMCVLVLM